MMYALIGRLHIGGNNQKNSWSQLKKHFNYNIRPIESTKAVIEVVDEQDIEIIRKKLNDYNNKYHTDFYIR